MKIAAHVFSLALGIFILLFSSVCLAETALIDVIVMKDGTEIKGTLLQLNTGEVRIQTLDGEELVKPFDDVLTFRQDSITSEAADTSPADGDPDEAPPFFDRHTWQIGTEVYLVTYEEPSFMEETGAMAGLHGSYAYHNHWMFKADIRLASGQLDYTSSGTGRLDDIDNTLLETRGLVGYDFVYPSQGAVTVFSGFGYRYLEDDSAGRQTTTGANGYRRESNYLYSPIGIESVAQLAEKWRLSVLIEYDYFWKGRQKSHLSDASPAYGSLSNDQNDGFGLRASIGASRTFGWGTLMIEPFYRYWDIGESEKNNLTFAGAIVGVGWEPASTTTEAGLSVSCSW
jgi:hypothetical protein